MGDDRASGARAAAAPAAAPVRGRRRSGGQPGIEESATSAESRSSASETEWPRDGGTEERREEGKEGWREGGEGGRECQAPLREIFARRLPSGHSQSQAARALCPAALAGQTILSRLERVGSPAVA